MKKISRISISEVLSLLKEGHRCQIDYRYGTGRKRGQHRKFTSIVYGFGNGRGDASISAALQKAKENDRKKVQRRYRGLVPMIDLVAQQGIDLKISHIQGYNGKKVIH